MKTRIILLFTALSLAVNMSAQQYQVKATDCYEDIMDLSQRSTRVIDQNGEQCAVLRIKSAIPGLLRFEFGTQDIERKEIKDDEVWLWISATVKKMTIRCDGCKPLKDYRPGNLVGGHIYSFKVTTGLPKEQANKQHMHILCHQVPFFVSIDGKPAEESTKNQFSRELSLGTHNIVVSATHYKSFTKDIKLTRSAAARDTVNLEPNYGTVTIRPNVQGCKLFIDNQEFGINSEIKLDVGRHQISVRKEKYTSYEEKIVVHIGDQHIVNANLTPIASTTPSVGSTPPNLTIVDESVAFVDQSQNNVIDAAEKCSIRFKIRNMGKGAANGCVATVRMSKDYYGISVQNRKLTTIAPGATMDVEIPLISNIETKTGQVTFSVEVTEPNGFGTDPFELTVNTHAFEQPYIQIVDYAITGNTGGTLVKKQPFNLQLMLQNTKYGRAENVEVEIVLPDNVFMLDGLQKTVIKELDGGKAKSLDFQLVVNNNYSNTFIPIQVKLKEKYGQFAENKTVTFQLNQNLASTRLTVKAAEEELVKQEIQLATIGSAVDKNIPVTKEKKSNTFAVIIANENYEQVAKVPYAINDGSIFKQYCEKTLGIPATNIHFVPDATINNIRQQVNWLSQVCQAYNGQANIIFYYAGHGVPDEQSKTAFLLPKDGNGMDITTGYKLDDLYKTLGQLPAKSVTIFLDACFSGSKREDGMLTSARGIAIKVKNGQPVGKMVVFTAATGDETAYPNNTEGHGMFTYYLLKKLQETSGNVTYEELGDYIRQNVSRQSIVLNGKSQTPTVIPSADATDWQNWKLK